MYGGNSLACIVEIVYHQKGVKHKGSMIIIIHVAENMLRALQSLLITTCDITFTTLTPACHFITFY